MAPVLVLSTADFDSDVWTNKQHLASRLAEHTDVVYYGSLGLRQPTFARRDLLRLAATIWHAFAGLFCGRKNATPDSTIHRDQRVRIVKPLLIPFYQFGFVRRFNSIVARLQLRRALRNRPVLWSFSPNALGLERFCRSVVYHSVDLLHEVKGIDRPSILEAERELLRNADAVIASSNGVKDHLNTLVPSAEVRVWQNVADVGTFSRETGAIRLPRLIFAGNLTPSKVDFELLAQISEVYPVLCAGPYAIDGAAGRTQVEALMSLSGITYLGNLSPSELAEAMHTCMAGLIPYHVNRYTDGVFPMKVYEYLSAGLSVISTPIRGLKGVEVDGLTIASREQYVEAACREIDNFEAAGVTVRKLSAEPHSWDLRVAAVVQLLRQLEGASQ